MKKITGLLLASTLALGFVACDKNANRNDELLPESNTTLSVVSARIANVGSTKAITDSQTDVEGINGEDKVKDGYLFFETAAGKALEMTQDASNKSLFKSKAIEIAPNPAAKVALLLNKNVDLNLNDFNKEKTIELADLKHFTKADGFMMTSKVADASNTIKVEANIDDAKLAQGKNNFAFNVERVVAKLQVEKKKALNIVDDLKKKGDVNEKLTFALAGSAKKAYLFRDNAGDRQLDKDTEGKHIYKGFKSVIDTENEPELQKVSDDLLKDLFQTPKDVNEVGAKKSSTATGFYFLENSMYGGDKVATAKAQILFKRIVYAKVYTSFTAKAGKKLTAITDGKYTYKSTDLIDATADDFNKVRTYKVIAPKAWYDAHKNDPALKDKFEEKMVGNEKQYILTVTDKAGTFYVGADNLIYDTQLAAAAAGNLTYRKYDGGKMVYLTPANAQRAGDLINYCDTRRNNIYDLTIAGFADLGLNYDPVDPKDPNIPTPPDNPGEPTPNPNIPVQDEVTKMQVTSTILKWNSVTRDVTLGI